MSTSAFTTPDKKRSTKASPPAAPLKKRLRTKAKKLAPLLLISSKDGEIRPYSSNHSLFAEVGGHYDDEDIELFYTDEMYERVVRIIGNDGSTDDRELPLSEGEVVAMKKATLVTFFSEEIFGGGAAEPGEVFRGTIVVSLG